MKITKKIAAETPTCKCGGYLEEGDITHLIHGTYEDRPARWYPCPDCDSALALLVDSEKSNNK